MKKNSSSIREMFKYLKPHIFLIFLSLIFAASSVVLTLYFPILIGSAIDCIVEIGRVDFATIKPILMRAGVTVLLTAVLQFIMNFINNKIAFGVVCDVRRAAFAKMQILPLSFMDSKPSGEIVSRIISDVDTFADGLLMGFTQLFTGVVTIIGTLIFMFALSPSIAVIVVLITPLSLFVARFIAKRTHSFFEAQSDIRAEQTALIDETIANQNLVTAFSKGSDMSAHFRSIDKRLVNASLKATFFSSLVNPCTRFVNSLVYAAVGCFGALSVIGAFGNAVLTVGTLSSFLSYANQYTKPFNEISGVVTELQNALTCAERIFAFINETPEAVVPVDAKVLCNISGGVQIKNVDFSYSPDRPLIRNFNLSVNPGEHIAIVGPTGCGKTTLINLLMRFYDVDDGSISVDGSDIRCVTRHSLRAAYGMVLQDTWLKSSTVRDNIKLGMPDATDAQVITAAKAAHAHSFIKRLPNGYDTVVDENGGLSEGQRQLLCIARVMIALPPMLILDEATSSIDTMTEMRIQKAFAAMTAGRTSFIVAHRLSTIREADKILVMKDGNVIETGTHDELLAKGGFYKNLYYSQFEN